MFPIQWQLLIAILTTHVGQAEIKQDSKLGSVATPAIHVCGKLRQKNHSKSKTSLG